MPHATTQINPLKTLRRDKEAHQLHTFIGTTQAKCHKSLRRGMEERQMPTSRVTTQA